MNPVDKKPKVTIGFLGNIEFDTRTFNLFKSLKSRGHEADFVGFDWSTPGFHTVRRRDRMILRLKKRKLSLLFYVQFAAILGFRLLRKRSDIYWAADFYALPLCYAAARFWGARLFYDSREIYTGIAGFTRRPRLLSWVTKIEGFLARRCDQIFTTGEKDSEIIERLHGLGRTHVLRNLPLRIKNIQPVDYRPSFPNPTAGKILVYQGLLARGRGVETCLEIISRYPEGALVLVGWGDLEIPLQEMAARKGILDRVLFAGKIPQQELLRYTSGADVGLSLIDNVSQNNAYALPNKLFEYLMAGLPVIVTDLPQMRDIVDRHRVGKVVLENDVASAVETLRRWDRRSEEFRSIRFRCREAASELNWESEFERVFPFFAEQGECHE